MSLFKKVAKSVSKKVLKPASRAAVKTIGGDPSPGFRKIVRAVKTYNPVTGPVGAIKKVTKALKAPQKKGRR